VEVAHLGFSDDGAAVVGLDTNRAPVAAWDADSGSEVSVDVAPRFVEPSVARRSARRHGLERNVELVVSDTGVVETADLTPPPRGAMFHDEDIHYPFALSRAGDIAAELAWPSRTGAQPEVVRWETSTLRRLPSLPAPNGDAPLTALALSADGRWVAAGGADWLVYLWDQSTGELRASLPGHLATVRGVAFSPDCRTLYSISGDEVVLAWAVGSVL
jgi:WD40 repeat protein